MVESTAVSCIHPVIQTRIIILWTELFPKEEEREDPRGDSSIYLRVQWCFHILQELQCFHTQSSNSK